MNNKNEVNAQQNVKYFILFRIAFNARFYYPVLAIIFLDLGLSLEQYALLNVAWAVSIVGLEVPSGVLADIWGRKKLVVLASFLMFIEMLIFAFSPTKNVQLLFYLFLFNRVLSGAAEAAASGADEALVYDSLLKVNKQSTWPNVLAKLGKLQSISFFIAMIIGAAVYDPSTFNTIGKFFGVHWDIQSSDVIKFPIYLTLLLTFFAIYAALKMIDPQEQLSEAEAKSVSFKFAIKEIIVTAKWIFQSPTAFFVIFIFVCNDSVARLFGTMNSQYYRVLGLPEASYGLLGSSFALVGILSPIISKKLIIFGSPHKAFFALSLFNLISLYFLSHSITYIGLVWALFLLLGMGVSGFLCSYYLNETADSKKRATILSFKGLAGNLMYGTMGVYFSGLLKSIEAGDPGASKNLIFMNSLEYLPLCFLVIFVLAFGVGCLQKRIIQSSNSSIK